MFKVFVTEIKNQFNKRVKRLRSDRGTKYDSVVFNEFYNSKGITELAVTILLES